MNDQFARIFDRLMSLYWIFASDIREVRMQALA